MKKIRIRKNEMCIFDGSRVTNGHWAITLDACTTNFVFNEPYQFLIENGLQFKKDVEMRPVLQATLPNLQLVMTEGQYKATITDVSINGARVVSWEHKGDAGTCLFNSEFIDLLRDLGDYHTLSEMGSTGMIAACKDGVVLAVAMPLGSHKTDKESSIRPVWEALQMEMDIPSKDEPSSD